MYESGWTEEELSKLQFTNIATCFGKSHRKDKEGRDLYLNCLDIDSEEVFTRLSIITDEHGKHRFLMSELCEHTYVTKTKKKDGRHVYWFSHSLNSAIHSHDCNFGDRHCPVLRQHEADIQSYCRFILPPVMFPISL